MLVADTHVHIYPFYDLEKFFERAISNLSTLAPGGAAHGLFLTERHDCHFFRRAKAGEIVVPGVAFEATSQDEALLVRNNEDGLFLFAGRQINTRERIEVLALTVDLDIADGSPIRDVIDAIHQARGIPVLSWAPGKWFFDRGKIVREMIESYEPGQLLIGDTSLRPTVWREPFLMGHARRKGMKILAGSDPLPFTGEEGMVGTYGSCGRTGFDPHEPVTSVRNMMRCEDVLPLAGRRCGAVEVMRRLKKNRDAKGT